ncbi:MAG: tagaturonate reductase [Clostridiales bacterium]|jgi:tagaturonate reductase|nr:tagaturonate reductase [Clostridiales bacterium]
MKKDTDTTKSSLPQLSAKFHSKPKRKIKVMQFGEGNFLRAFCDWMIDCMNKNINFLGGVVVVQPQPFGRVKELQKQDGLYNLYSFGFQDSKVVERQELIDVLDDFIDPYTQYAKFLSYASSVDLQTIISNTTEAGIALDTKDTDFEHCPNSFPGKLLAFLYNRYLALGENGGLNIIPCELIDNNGDELKRVLLQLCEVKKFDDKFVSWLSTKNRFCNTLVDRIVPGYPKEDIEQYNVKNGYTDNSAIKAEVFDLWVLQDVKGVKQSFPVHLSGCNAIFVDDIKPYKERKVKILNGSHTALTPVAYLAGFDTVKESVEDSVIGSYLNKLILDEICLTIDLPQKTKVEFANSVLDRFKNPFIRHELMSIALNSTSKFNSRLVPSLKKYLEITGNVPKYICFALAAFILFHRGKRDNQKIVLKDDVQLLQKWSELSQKYLSDDVGFAQSCIVWLSDLWGYDLTPCNKLVLQHVQTISKNGIVNALNLL